MFRKAKAQRSRARDSAAAIRDGSSAGKVKLAAGKSADKPWMKAIGGLRHLHDENVRIQKLIDEEFEQIEPEDWD